MVLELDYKNGIRRKKRVIEACWTKTSIKFYDFINIFCQIGASLVLQYILCIKDQTMIKIDLQFVQENLFAFYKNKSAHVRIFLHGVHDKYELWPKPR